MSPHQLWGCCDGCPGRNLTLPLRASLLPPSQFSNRQGEKTLYGTARFISILILEPHFQQIVKLLFNYKQNIRAFPLSELGRVCVEGRTMKTALQERLAWRFPPVQFPACLNQSGLPCWGPLRMVPSFVTSEGSEHASRGPSSPVTRQTLQVLLQVLLPAGSCSDMYLFPTACLLSNP